MSEMCALLVAASVVFGQAEAKKPVLPEKIAQQLQFFVGEWNVEGEVAGAALKGRWSTRWSPKKHCLVINYPLSIDDQQIQGNGVFGWDTETEELMTFMFYSNGVLEICRYKLVSPGVLKGTFAGSAQGKPYKAECELRTNGADEWTFTTKRNIVGGKEEKELLVRFARSEGKAKKKGK